MALTKIICPHCKSDLKPPKPVPEGTRLKCPKCKKGFTAGQDEDDLLIRLDDDDEPPKKAGGIVEEVSEPADKKKKKAVDAIDVIDVLEDDSAPVKKKEPAKKAAAEKKAAPKSEKKEEKKPEPKPAASADDDGPGTTYGLVASDDEEEEEAPRGKKGGGGGGKKKKKPEIDHAPDTSVKDPRGPAQEKVIVCTNYMLMSAIVGFFGYLGLIILIMIPTATPITVDQGTKDSQVEILTVNGGLGGGIGMGESPGAASPEAEPKEKPSLFTVFDVDMALFVSYGVGFVILILLPLVLGMAYSGLIAYGAVQAQSMESRSWGIAGSIMTIISYQIFGLAILLCWAVEILMIGVLDNDLESTRNMEYGILALLIVSEIAAGVYVLVTLLQEDVKAGFEYVPEG